MSRLLEYEEQKRSVVEKICIKARIVTVCEIHEVTMDNSNGDYEPAYKLANKLITDKDELIEVFNGDRMELTDSIKSFMDDTGDVCYYCEYI